MFTWGMDFVLAVNNLSIDDKRLSTFPKHQLNFSAKRLADRKLTPA